jgi:hypothetical protein
LAAVVVAADVAIRPLKPAESMLVWHWKCGQIKNLVRIPIPRDQDKL